MGHARRITLSVRAAPCAVLQPYLSNINTDNPDLSEVRNRGVKIRAPESGSITAPT